MFIDWFAVRAVPSGNPGGGPPHSYPVPDSALLSAWVPVETFTLGTLRMKLTTLLALSVLVYLHWFRLMNRWPSRLRFCTPVWPAAGVMTPPPLPQLAALSWVFDTLVSAWMDELTLGMRLLKMLGPPERS